MLLFLLLALSTLVGFTSAQSSTVSQFANGWLASYVVGQTYTITWTAGDDEPVSLTLSNSTFSRNLVAMLSPQISTTLSWTVPKTIGSGGVYVLSLSQSGRSTVSPHFTVTGSAESMSSVTGAAGSSNAIPSIAFPSDATPSSFTPSTPIPFDATPSTVTGSMAIPSNATMFINSTIITSAPACTGTGSDAAATSTYWDISCGCNKTAVGPVSASGMPGSFNYTTPTMSTGMTVPSPSPYIPAFPGSAVRMRKLSGKELCAALVIAAAMGFL